jgi:hypothetical protein
MKTTWLSKVKNTWIDFLGRRGSKVDDDGYDGDDDGDLAFKMAERARCNVLQGGPDSNRQFLIITNQSIQQRTGKWESTFCCR